MKASPIHAPIPLRDRIQSLDVLRGFALLGILLLNMQGYAMIEAAYLNPTAFGNFTGANKAVWALAHVFGDLKFMGLFGVLFGAGIVLMTERAEAKQRGSAGLHYRRTFWLLVFGLLHAYVLWYGDILVSYALCGLVVYWFRKCRPTVLLVFGMIALLPPSLFFLLAQVSLPYSPEAHYQQMLRDWLPDAGRIAGELAAYRGGWLEQMAYRVPASLKLQTFLFVIWFGWRAGGLMLLGMALLKWGILTAERPDRFYRRIIITGLGIGLPLIVLGVLFNFANDWSLNYSMFLGSQFNYWGSLFVALAYLGVVMLVVRHSLLPRACAALAAVGRTALTNYIAQSVICTTIFYGHGLGLFGKVERWQQLLLVVAIWAVQIAVSVVWLRHFRFGPLEWLWRSLTYGRWQLMRNRPASSPNP